MDSGFLIIDKPKGWTSFDVVRFLRKTFHLKSVGHAGTLDPMATGVLVILIGRATRLMDIFLTKEKRYQGHLRLGMVTTTDDVTGDIVRCCSVPAYHEQERNAILAQIKNTYQGEISQIPPLYSALKVDGQRSYELARDNKSVALACRNVHIFQAEFFFISAQEIGFDLTCSSGTYIRSIARDIGQDLGVGGTLGALRRTACSGFSIAQARRVEQLHSVLEENENYFPLSQVAELFPYHLVETNVLQQLFCGRQDALKEVIAELPACTKFPLVITSAFRDQFAVLQNDGQGSIKMKCL